MKMIKFDFCLKSTPLNSVLFTIPFIRLHFIFHLLEQKYKKENISAHLTSMMFFSTKGVWFYKEQKKMSTTETWWSTNDGQKPIENYNDCCWCEVDLTIFTFFLFIPELYFLSLLFFPSFFSLHNIASPENEKSDGECSSVCCLITQTFHPFHSRNQFHCVFV